MGDQTVKLRVRDVSRIIFPDVHSDEVGIYSYKRAVSCSVTLKRELTEVLVSYLKCPSDLGISDD